MIENEYIERVFRRVAEGNPQAKMGVYRNAIQATKDDARHKFAQLMIGRPEQSLLENDYALTITGTNAAFGANTDLLPESIIAADNVRHSSVAKKFKPVATSSDLDFVAVIPGMPFGFYHVGKSGVDFAYSSALVGTLTVRAIKVPTLALVPAQLEHYLIDIGTGLAINKLLEQDLLTPDQALKAK